MRTKEELLERDRQGKLTEVEKIVISFCQINGIEGDKAWELIKKVGELSERD